MKKSSMCKGISCKNYNSRSFPEVKISNYIFYHLYIFTKTFILQKTHTSSYTGRDFDMKQKSSRSGKTRTHTSIHEPMAEYLQDTGPVITVDATGRMVLPKKIRDHYNANRFEVRETKGHIELIPVKPLSSLLGIFPDLDIEAIYCDHDREVAEEDAE
jgi:bifunctional DNA-binding transcriptional regulator/antitoxin component of YhaV-PrlF toxin-antitoxin module